MITEPKSRIDADNQNPDMDCEAVYRLVCVIYIKSVALTTWFVDGSISLYPSLCTYSVHMKSGTGNEWLGNWIDWLNLTCHWKCWGSLYGICDWRIMWLGTHDLHRYLGARIIHLLHHFLHIKLSFIMPAGLLSHMDTMKFMIASAIELSSSSSCLKQFPHYSSYSSVCSSRVCTGEYKMESHITIVHQIVKYIWNLLPSNMF